MKLWTPYSYRVAGQDMIINLQYLGPAVRSGFEYQSSFTNLENAKNAAYINKHWETCHVIINLNLNNESTHLQFSMLWFPPFPESDDSNLAARASPTSTPSFRRLSATTDDRIVGDETPDMTRKFTHPKASKQQDMWFSIKLVSNKIVGCHCWFAARLQ